jgi:hypothetical protein
VRLNVEPGYTAGQRCWQWVGNEGQCPTHGDVREVQRYFELTAELTPIAELVGAR